MATEGSRRARRQALARAGEHLAARALERQGFRIIGRNVRVGRLEMDILARRADLLVVCEVRSRSGPALVDPALTVTPDKQRRIRRAALAWLSQRRGRPLTVRFDVASVVFTGANHTLRYYEHAF